MYLRNLYWPQDFGGNRYAWEVTRRLATRGHDVRVLTGESRSAGGRTSTDGVRITYFPTQRGNPLVTHAANVTSSWRPIRRMVRERADVVLVGSYDVGLPLSFERDRPASIFFYHSSFYSEAIERLGRGSALARMTYRPIRAYMDAVERRVLDSADRVVAVSDFSLKEIGEKAPRAAERTRLVHTGVDTAFYVPPIDDGAVRSARVALGIRPGERVLAVVGRLVGVKRYDRAIETVVELRRGGVDATLLVIGDGPDRARLQQHAIERTVADKVRFLGFLTGAPHRDALWASDVQLCSSEFENLSLALLEGLAAGVPVVGVPTGGTVGLLNAIDPRLLAGESTAQALAAAARPILADAALRAALARRGRDHVVEKHDWERVTAEIDRLCAEVSARGR